MTHTLMPENQEDLPANGAFAANDVCSHCEEYKSGWQRAQADYLNLQKEISAKRGEWAAWSEWQILEEFVPVYDHFKKAFGHQETRLLRQLADTDGQARNNPPAGGQETSDDDKGWENWVKGIEYIMKQFGDVLKLHGIEEIETVGKKFDPALHEVLGEEDSDKEAGMIVKEVDGGYKKGEKVLKVAKVIVAK